MRPYPLKGLKVLYNNNKLEGQKGQNTGNENAYDAWRGECDWSRSGVVRQKITLERTCFERLSEYRSELWERMSKGRLLQIEGQFSKSLSASRWHAECETIRHWSCWGCPYSDWLVRIEAGVKGWLYNSWLVRVEAVKDPGHSAKSAGGRLRSKHTCTFDPMKSEWTDYAAV